MDTGGLRRMWTVRGARGRQRRGEHVSAKKRQCLRSECARVWPLAKKVCLKCRGPLSRPVTRCKHCGGTMCLEQYDRCIYVRT